MQSSSMKEARKPLLRKGKNGKVESSIDALDAYQVVAKAHRSELVFVSSPLRDNPYLRDACSPARGKSPRKSPRPAKA